MTGDQLFIAVVSTVCESDFFTHSLFFAKIFLIDNDDDDEDDDVDNNNVVDDDDDDDDDDDNADDCKSTFRGERRYADT